MLLEAGYDALCYEMWLQQSQTKQQARLASRDCLDESAAQGRASLPTTQ